MLQCEFVKKNGERISVPLCQNTEGDITTMKVSNDYDWSEIDFVDIDLHEGLIQSGDNGFYVVNAGGAYAGENAGGVAYSVGHFIDREDMEFGVKRLQVPMYAFKYEGKGVVGIVTGMTAAAEQRIIIKDNTYKMQARFVIDGVTPFEPITMEIHTVNNPDADYGDLARVYRNYLFEKRGFQSIKDRINPELKYCTESINVRIRMAWKPVPTQVLEQTEENEPPVHVAVSFDDVVEIIESYHDLGIEKVEFCLVGWNKSGHDGRWPQILPVEESIGGEEGLKKVIALCKRYGYQMTCHTNSTDAYSIANNFNKDDIALKRDGEFSIESERWGGGRAYNVCPKRAYEISMETLPAVRDLGFRGLHYIDVITCTPERECFNPLHPVNKREGSQWFDKLFKETREMFGAVGCEGPYDHAMKYCDSALYINFMDYHIDLKETFVPAERLIPFWELIYHGIVLSNPFTSTVNAVLSPDKTKTLKLVEYGARPHLYYYAGFVTDGSNWIGGKEDFTAESHEVIREQAKYAKETVDFYNQFAHLQYEFMEHHTEIAENVFETVYSDGTKVTVDYNNETYRID